MSARLSAVGALGVSVAACVTTVVIVVVGPGQGSGFLGDAGVVLQLLGFVIVVVGWIRIFRHHVVRRTALSRGLDKDDRRRIVAQVRGKRPVEQNDLPTAVRVADGMRTQWVVIPGYTGWQVYGVGVVMHPMHWPSLAWFVAVLTVLMSVGVAALALDAWRADTFLDHHTDAVNPPTPAT